MVSPPAGLSRRRLLEAGAAAGAALLLGACGAEQRRPGRAGEATVLRSLLAHEAAVVAALAAAADGLHGAEARRARRMVAQDRRHAATLAAALGAAAMPASPPAGAPTIEVALARKEAALAAYVDALPRIGDGDLRVTVLQLAAAEAEHLAVLRLLLGREAAPGAFGGLA